MQPHICEMLERPRVELNGPSANLDSVQQMHLLQFLVLVVHLLSKYVGIKVRNSVVGLAEGTRYWPPDDGLIGFAILS